MSSKTPSPTDENNSERESSPSIATIQRSIVPDSNGLLNISGKDFSRISERHIRTFAHQITSVDVSSNKFTALDFLKLLPRCHRVYAGKNQLRRLISLAPLKNVLEVLDLSENQIGSTEHYLSQFTRLKVLNLSNNFLHVFPSINELTNLTFLDISFNDFMGIPNFKRLSNLLILKMNNNEIYSLKDALHSLPDSITTLEMAGNKISDLNEIVHLKFLVNLQHFSFASNPCILKPYDTFNYRVFIVAKILSLSTVDEKEVNDSERLTAEYLHTQKKIASFFPDAGRHDALVKFLEKECPLNDADPLLNLTPSHPKLEAVRQDYLHNKTDDELSILDTTPRRRNVRSAEPKIRSTDPKNIRRISPPPKPSKRSKTFDESSSFRLPPFDSTKFTSMKPLSTYLNDSNDSVASNNTVTITESESINLNVALPVIDTTESDDEKEEEEEPTQEIYTSPKASNTVHRTPPHVPTLRHSDDDDADDDDADDEVFVEQRSNTSSQRSSGDSSPILPRLTLQAGWTEIVKESPFKSVLHDTPKHTIIENRPPARPSSDNTFQEETTQKIEDTTKTLDRAMDSAEILEKLCELKKDSKNEDEQNWNQVIQNMKNMAQKLEALQRRVQVLEAAPRESPSNNIMEAIQMFMPMPSNIQVSKEPNTQNYTLSWDTVVPVQPTIRGFGVFIDGKFHSEVKAPVVRVRGPLVNGQKISLQSISATNIRSLPGEIIINQESDEGDKENSKNSFLQPGGILTARSM
uniref:Leucine-rich repeat-containing protein n=1 Tax=Panagrolaimus sp. ES5 TaxID=591445 RepID=A0AC34FJ16_9BILA